MGIWSLGMWRLPAAFWIGHSAALPFSHFVARFFWRMFGGCIRRMGAWIQYFQTLGHSNFIGYQNNVGHTHNWYVLPCSRATMVNWTSSFPRNGWFWDQFEWASIANLVVQRPFREKGLTTSELHWKFLIWSICKNGITWDCINPGFLSGFFQPCARVFCGQTHIISETKKITVSKTWDFCPLGQPTGGVWGWVFLGDIPIKSQ